MRRRRAKGRVAVGLVAAGAVAIAALGCSRSPEMRAAYSGDGAALGRLIGLGEKAGTLTNRRAAEIARVVADRDVRGTLGPDSVARLEGIRSCARELDEALAARMRVHDAGGAVAALARVESGTQRADTLRSFFSDPLSSWRAVGARGLIHGEDRQLRQRTFADADPEVRRQAIRAARHAGDPSDLHALAEAARSDPDPSLRREAVHALGALPSSSESRDVANALRDLWTSADEELRQDIALGWSTTTQWHAGGREALGFVVDTARGLSVIQAAEAILRHPDAGADSRTEAVARLGEIIAEGSRSERLRALAVAPVDAPALVDAMTIAARDEDTSVRVAALSRLAQLGRSIAVAELEALAQPGAPAANKARFALAMAGDRRIQLWLEQSLVAPRETERMEAGIALVRLGVAARAAPLLVDSEPRVRMRAACEIMLAVQ